MDMEQHSPYKLVLLMIVAVLGLAGFAYVAQKPHLSQNIPFMGPTPTPTPLASANIVLYSPHSNDQVTEQFEITGKARVSTNVVSIRLIDKLSGFNFGQTQTTTDASQPGQFGNFKAEVQLDNPNLKSGEELFLEVFQVSQNGNETDKITVPIKFTPID